MKHTKSALRRVSQNEKRKSHTKIRKAYQTESQQLQSAMRRNRINGLLRLLFGGAVALFFGSFVFLLIIGYAMDSQLQRHDFALAMLAAVALFGVWIARKGQKRLRMQKCYPGYAKALVREPECTLADFAKRIGSEKKQKQVKKRLLAMLKAGFFPDAYLNLRTNSIHSLRLDALKQEEKQPEQGFVQISCPRCQAKNTVPEENVGICYCCGAAI